MNRYYKVIKENFLWEVGAILELDESLGRSGGYLPLDEDLFCKHETSDDWKEYLSKRIVENSPDFFQRVYKVNIAKRMFYESKEKAKQLMGDLYKS